MEYAMDLTAFCDQLRARLRRVLILEGVARLLLAILVLVAVLIGLDWLFLLPNVLRLGCLLALVTSVVVVVRQRIARPLGRPMDDRNLARLIERRLPALDGRLISGVEGLTLSANDHHELSSMLGAGAAARLVPARSLPRQLALALLAMACAAIVAVLVPEVLRAGMTRLLLPFAGAEWTPSTQLTATLERHTVPADEPLVLEVSRPHGSEGTVKVEWLAAGSVTAESRTLDGAVGAVVRRQTLTLPAGSYRLRVTSGDAHPVELTARVVARPMLSQINATLTPPAYVGEPPQALATLACTALQGSTLHFTVEFAFAADRTVEHCALTLAGEPVSVTRTAQGFTGELSVKTGGEFLVTIADQDGIGPKPEPRFSLGVVADRAPDVHLDGPRNNEAVSPRAKVTIKVDARDDHGLAALGLLRQVIPVAPEGTQPKPSAEDTLMIFPGISGLATTRPHVVEIGALAKIGERLVLLGRAHDANNITGPGVGTSEPLVLRVVSEEDLRQDLERLLSDALERVRQSREELGKGLSKADQLGVASRNATLSARKAAEVLDQVKRRAVDNQFPDEQVEPMAKAAGLVGVGALPRLAEASNGGEKAGSSAREADAKLAEAERVLASMRQESDLSRQLGHLLGMEKNVSAETKEFLKEHLTKALDDAAKARLADLSERQRGIAEQLKDLERRLLASTAPQLAEAQALVNKQQPAEQLGQAAQALAGSEQRAKAPGKQDAAIKAMEELLAKLRGNEANKGLADRLGDLADKQEQLVKELERGTDPKELTERQQELREETKKLESLVEQQAKDPEATKSVKGAGDSQEQAAGDMKSGDAGGAAREGSAAAAQLREAQRKLEGQQEDKDKQDQKKNADVMRLLKELRTLQVKVLNDSLPIHKRLGEQALDFAATRDLTPIADLQLEIHLRLTEEGIKELQQMPIAARALGRVAAAMQRAADHLGKPALGETGITLEKTALYELNRLIDVVDNMPQGKQGKQQGKGGDGQQAPFPPAAELGLMIAEQEDLARRVATNAPQGDPAVEQKALLDLVEFMRQQSRPGTRPAVLLDRAARAMASSAYVLAQKQRGLTVRHEQELAVAALRRILAEAESGGGGGGGGGSSGKNQKQQNQPPQDPQDQQDPSDPSKDPSSGGNAKPSGNGGNASDTNPGDKPGAVVVVPGDEDSPLMHLPQERRDQLREAKQQHLPPAALKLYQRYLELLEGDR